MFLYYGGKKSLVKTYALIGATYSTFVFFRVFPRLGEVKDMESLRRLFDYVEYEVAIVFVIIFYYIVIKKQWLFGKVFDIYTIIIMGAHLILTLERSVWIGVGVGCFILIIVPGIYGKKNLLKTMTRSVLISGLFAIAIILAFNFLPDTVSDTLTDKFLSTSNEISSVRTFNSSGDAQENWRGYEIYCAKKQWKESSGLAMIFGEGMGRGTKIQFVPDAFKDYIVGRQIPLLHNAYYTILPKGGIFGVCVFIWFFLANIHLAIKTYRKKIFFESEAVTLMAIIMVFMIQAYVVRGPVGQEVTCSWALYIGWINAALKKSNFRTQKEQTCLE